MTTPRKKAQTKPAATTATDLTFQMPLWPEKARGLPNSFARSALFCVGSRATRRNLNKAKIASFNDTEMFYTGSELRQDDEDVFLQLVHLMRGRTATDMVDFSGYGMLKELGWGYSKRSYDRLRDCLDRLKANALQVASKDKDTAYVYSGSLIRKYVATEQEGTRQTWRVWFEKEVVRLFGPMSYSELEWAQRTHLKGEISKWLHGFYVTMRDCPPIAVETLKRLCGSQCASLGAFRQMLRASFQELKDVGFVADFKVDTDYVYVSRDDTTPINRIRPSNMLENFGAVEKEERVLMD